MPEITLDVYKAMVGQEVGVSRWLEVPQERIDAVPTFIVGEDVFFGNDRLEFLEERLRS